LCMHGEAQVCGARRGDEAKVEAFEKTNSSKIGKKCARVNLRRRNAQDRGSEPSDLEKKSRQSLDLGKLHRI
jgi:hypothetical protein